MGLITLSYCEAISRLSLSEGVGKVDFDLDWCCEIVKIAESPFRQREGTLRGAANVVMDTHGSKGESVVN